MLPLPQDLIQVVTDHQLIRGCNDQQSIHKRLMGELIHSVHAWDTRTYNLVYPGHARLNKFRTMITRERRFYWDWISLDLVHPSMPRATIDQQLQVEKLLQAKTPQYAPITS
jgi:hypothetical protein